MSVFATEFLLFFQMLLCRPDGSFSIVTDKSLYMIVAAPNTDGQPDPEKIHFVQ